MGLDVYIHKGFIYKEICAFRFQFSLNFNRHSTQYINCFIILLFLDCFLLPLYILLLLVLLFPLCLYFPLSSFLPFSLCSPLSVAIFLSSLLSFHYFPFILFIHLRFHLFPHALRSPLFLCSLALPSTCLSAPYSQLWGKAEATSGRAHLPQRNAFWERERMMEDGGMEDDG